MMKQRILRTGKWVSRLLAGIIVLSISACANMNNAADPRSAVVPDKIYNGNDQLSEGGIWPGDTSNNLLFEDAKARGVGDIVTVVFDESATASTTASTDTSKDSTIAVDTDLMFGLPSNLGIQDFLGSGRQFTPNLSANTSRSNQGTGTTSRQGSLTGTLSAVITKVLPNGNFEIEGRRSVVVNNEEQISILRGTIRPFDINFTNQINSSLVANASITYTGSGVVSDEQRVGWATRIISFVWPF